MAALDVIVREAGGRFTSLDGRDGPTGGNALASNGILHDTVLGFLGSVGPHRDRPTARRTTRPSPASRTAQPPAAPCTTSARAGVRRLRSRAAELARTCPRSAPEPRRTTSRSSVRARPAARPGRTTRSRRRRRWAGCRSTASPTGSSGCQAQVPSWVPSELQPGHDDARRRRTPRGEGPHRRKPRRQTNQNAPSASGRSARSSAVRRPQPERHHDHRTPPARSRRRTNGRVPEREGGEVDQAVPGRDVGRHVVEAVDVDLEPGAEGVLHDGRERDDDQRLGPHQRRAPAQRERAARPRSPRPAAAASSGCRRGRASEHDA